MANLMAKMRHVAAKDDELMSKVDFRGAGDDYITTLQRRARKKYFQSKYMPLYRRLKSAGHLDYK